MTEMVQLKMKYAKNIHVSPFVLDIQGQYLNHYSQQAFVVSILKHRQSLFKIRSRDNVLQKEFFSAKFKTFSSITILRGDINCEASHIQKLQTRPSPKFTFFFPTKSLLCRYLIIITL